jgi:hypothetical protein
MRVSQIDICSLKCKFTTWHGLTNFLCWRSRRLCVLTNIKYSFWYLFTDTSSFQTGGVETLRRVMYLEKTQNYKVVQIWPGQTVTCLHTISPGHIWTTLYLVSTSYRNSWSLGFEGHKTRVIIYSKTLTRLWKMMHGSSGQCVVFFNDISVKHFTYVVYILH